jgi:hypothetical protein
MVYNRRMGEPQQILYYPKAMYHRDVPGGKYVASPDEEKALGPEWVSHPNDVHKPFRAPQVPVVVEDLDDEASIEPVRGRGRPPGAKNKVKE